MLYWLVSLVWLVYVRICIFYRRLCLFCTWSVLDFNRPGSPVGDFSIIGRWPGLPRTYYLFTICRVPGLYTRGVQLGKFEGHKKELKLPLSFFPVENKFEFYLRFFRKTEINLFSGVYFVGNFKMNLFN